MKRLEEQGRPVVTLTIDVYEDGALAVRGPTSDPEWCIAVLANAIDAVRNHRRPKSEVVVPNGDVSIPTLTLG